MNKLYYSIGEISEYFDEEPHILRYWEKEFKQLNPKKNSAGNRKYSHKDFEVVKTIKKLLREEKLSLKGAKEKLGAWIDQQHEAIIPKESNKLSDTKNLTKELVQIDKVIGIAGEIVLSKQEAKELRELLQSMLSIL